MDIESYSHHGGKAALERMGVLEEIQELIEVWEAHAGQAAYGERKAAAADVGDWELQTQVDLGPYEAPHTERLTPFLDAYSRRYAVGVEHERKEQMRAR